MNKKINTLDNKLIDYIFFKLSPVEEKILKDEIEKSSILKERYFRILQHCDRNQFSYKELHSSIKERLFSMDDLFSLDEITELKENKELQRIKAAILSLKEQLDVFVNQTMVEKLYENPLAYIKTYFWVKNNELIYRDESSSLLKSPAYNEDFTKTDVHFVLKEKYTGHIHLLVKDNNSDIVFDEFIKLNNQVEVTVIQLKDLYPGTFYWTIINESQKSNTGHFSVGRESLEELTNQ